ncbi:MAG: inositol monophosphatase family protein [Sphaerochaetaceae bacterium]|jgi:fructose-1,6-bisphosphatase/inositol monophosphatase family enzyme
MSFYDELANLVVEMGLYASEVQKEITRSYKDDGTILTVADTTINTTISNFIKTNYPEANIVTEEEKFPFKKDAPITFILDPIDGTDVYSQGYPAWAISIGIINDKREAVGAMIYAPRWGLNSSEGLFLRLDPGGFLMLNGKEHTNRLENKELKQFSMASHFPSHLTFGPMPYKIRSFGTNILHMISPLIYKNVQGGVSIRCFVWDIAAAHALLIADGFKVTYYDNKPFLYTDDILVGRNKIDTFLTYGTDDALGKLQNEVTKAYKAFNQK